MRPHAADKPVCFAYEDRTICVACFDTPYRVAGRVGVESSKYRAFSHWYSAQDPAATTRWPPHSANCLNNSMLDATQRRFSAEVQYFPGTAYQARCSRCEGRIRFMSGWMQLESSRSAWCHIAPGIFIPTCELTACTSYPLAARIGMQCRPMKPLPPVSRILFKPENPDSYGHVQPLSRARRANRWQTQGRSIADPAHLRGYSFH